MKTMFTFRIKQIENWGTVVSFRTDLLAVVNTVGNRTQKPI